MVWDEQHPYAYDRIYDRLTGCVIVPDLQGPDPSFHFKISAICPVRGTCHEHIFCRVQCGWMNRMDVNRFGRDQIGKRSCRKTS